MYERNNVMTNSSMQYDPMLDSYTITFKNGYKCVWFSNEKVLTTYENGKLINSTACLSFEDALGIWNSIKSYAPVGREWYDYGDNRIAAIKKLREMFVPYYKNTSNLGLKEAKDIVEFYLGSDNDIEKHAIRYMITILTAKYNKNN
jgi:hypothetical protein